MRVIFTGTNGWFETATGNTLCVLLKTAEYDIILDAGSGFFRLDSYIDGSRPVFLLLSHFHMDHITGSSRAFKDSLFRGTYNNRPAGHAGNNQIACQQAVYRPAA